MILDTKTLWGDCNTLIGDCKTLIGDCKTLIGDSKTLIGGLMTDSFLNCEIKMLLISLLGV